MTAYRELETQFRRIGALERAIRILEWDRAAMMPPGGEAARAEELATLGRIVHELLASPRLGDLLEAAESEQKELDGWQSANLREMRRRCRHAAGVAPDLIEALSRARSRCEALWREARAQGDFVGVRGAFGEVLGRMRELAAAKAQALGLSPYEALLDKHEPGAKAAEIDRLFDEIGSFLPELIAGALSRQRREPAPPLPAGPFSIPAQRRLLAHLLTKIGFDFSFGRLDESAHPFCGGSPDDVRITTRYDEGEFSVALMAGLHELGHALYQRGLPIRWRGQPVGAARGMALHESQSLLLEMQACRSREFFAFAAPILGEAFGAAFEPEALYRNAVRVDRGLIRVAADEVTYPAHVILRYRLERAMIAGELAPAELPGAWSQGLEALLGVKPGNDREGCLQDIHWYDGYWGYFPVYLLGALIAAQLFAAARRAVPDLMAAIARGDFAPLLAWLSSNVHGQGSLLSTAQLVAAATGQPIAAAAFERHLRERYL